MERWWKAPKGQVHASVTATLSAIQNNQDYRRNENLRHVRLYGNFDALGLSANTYSRPNPATVGNRVTFNIIQSCIDTAAAKISKNKPRPTFITEGGDWGLQQKAKGLEQFIAGQFYGNNVYEDTQRTFVDSGVFGTGIYKVWAENGKICSERVIPDELKVDDSEGIYGKPRNKYHCKAVDRDVLAEMYPAHRALIMDLPRATENESLISNELVDQVTVAEAWHLPSGPKAKDGRHVIVINGADLKDETWTWDRFPFATYRWNNKLFGFWGQGISEQLIGIQLEINKLLKSIQLAHHLLSAPAYLVENGSNVITSHLSNEIGRIIKYNGTKPTVEVFQTIHPEIYQHLERLYQRAFEIIGISQLSAQSKKPAGLDSGKALREFNDIETERFMLAGQRWEQYHMDISDLYILTAKQLAKSESGLKFRTKAKNALKTISWSEVDMEEDQYQMQVFPTSGLSATPSARLQEVQEMVVSGLVDAETGVELLDMPDLKRHRDLRFAARDVIKDKVERIIDKGDFIPPEPFEDLAFALTYVQMVYNRAKLDGVPEDRLELLRRFHEQVKGMLDDAAGAGNPDAAPQSNIAPMAPPPPQAGLGQPQALPEAPLMPAAGQ